VLGEPPEEGFERIDEGVVAAAGRERREDDPETTADRVARDAT
jgi:hypothetical protein